MADKDKDKEKVPPPPAGGGDGSNVPPPAGGGDGSNVPPPDGGGANQAPPPPFSSAKRMVRIEFPKGYGAMFGAPRDPDEITVPEGFYPDATLKVFENRGATVHRAAKTKG